MVAEIRVRQDSLSGASTNAVIDLTESNEEELPEAKRQRTGGILGLLAQSLKTPAKACACLLHKEPPFGFRSGAVAPLALQELLGPALSRASADSSSAGCAFYSPLNEDGSSWLWLVRGMLPPGKVRFEALWSRHPPYLSKGNLFGKEVTFHRYQQAFGIDYAFSGQLARAAPLSQDEAPEVFFVKETLRHAIAQSGPQMRGLRYEACLANWYDGGGHWIGAHADDERDLVKGAPIFALSWGEERIFRVTPKQGSVGSRAEVELFDGDLVIMGGTCQRTHKHEVPKTAKRQGRRISLTFRCFEAQQIDAKFHGTLRPGSQVTDL